MSPTPRLSHLVPVSITPTATLRPPAIPLREAISRAAESARAEAYVQDSLAVDLVNASDAQLFGPQATPRADLPEPVEWAGQIAQAIVEVMSGVRLSAQVVRWTTPEVYAVIARRGAVAARRRSASPRVRPQRARVRSVRVCEPADGVAECSVVVGEGDRVRAMALRLVGQDGRWRVEALQIG